MIGELMTRFNWKACRCLGPSGYAWCCAPSQVKIEKEEEDETWHRKAVILSPGIPGTPSLLPTARISKCCIIGKLKSYCNSKHFLDVYVYGPK